ncbi:hypothetical protein [Weeksella virosa]|uniref:Mannosyltransferase n=1 Tax=Weeksella virosa (strain ATCC 43766 / DSM 16922 / JCM 21250 / CCUG 30538 / CDC 9751 / IAM 14551 / NBRC 16016 / NCTC 11634 / CL345/78) TaxID=865938 RepID=F0NXY9_WEEVC|nr:hypothetical protein [Weeksella virosa]ADX68057.1 putative mannosyltransferase [Weeksella virosa DSM 16922]VEH64310.1 Uncharacterised protein [Weeksella virosa]
MYRDITLHFVSMDKPYPPNYGGVIDVFFKLKSFYDLGVKIYLHVFGFDKKLPKELAQYAEKVFYYPIKQYPKYFFRKEPFSVASRNGKCLLENLLSIKAPIFFESMKTTDVLRFPGLEDYPKFLRLHNIEQNYFDGLSRTETNPIKKQLFHQESKKFIRYEAILGQFDEVFTLSNFEQNYIKKTYNKGTFVPVFHGNEKFSNLKGFGEFALYHGDLRAADNRAAVTFLIDVFSQTDYPLWIASSIKEDWVKKQIGNRPNIRFVRLRDFQHLIELFHRAHFNLSWSFQESGTKLKVVNALFNSRFSVINHNVIDDKRIAKMCVQVTTKEELLQVIEDLRNRGFDASDDYRLTLETYLSDRNNAEKILDSIFSYL